MNKEVKSVLKICDDFLKIPSVISFETPFLEYLDKKISKLGYKTVLKQEYLVVKPKTDVRTKYLFSAHIDRQGVVRNDKGDLEYAAFYFKKKNKSDFKREDIDFFEKVAVRHVNDYLYSYDKKKSKILRYDLDYKKKLVNFDIEKNFNGEVFGFESKIGIKEDLFFAQIDNVISAAVLYYVLKNYDFNQEIIFTTKEEIGRSYLNVLDYLKNRKSKIDIITLDTSPYENFNNKDDGFLTLREGDENGKFNLNLVMSIKKFLEDESIPIHFKPYDLGSTELGRISTESKGKFNGASIQLPTMNYHTTYESAMISSLENYLKILKYFLK